ncbi:uncharacterized protein LOC133779822 [Humulus lupulus]|uniref:uncharacterized protein LOC133779822 n=1 Tax=Humulus lupulus TaxID=3486 RepID=UPI002B408676|nr:uncharacterized protein LOC133779822 [Humulus lupulus]
MDINEIINKGLNEIASGFLSFTASWRRAGAMVSRERNFDSRLAQATQALEDEKAKLLEENRELVKLNEQLCEDQSTLTRELQESEAARNKAIDERHEWKENCKLNTQECKQLTLDLTASRDEVKKLEERVRELEEDRVKTLKKYKEAAFLSFYDLWKHNREADISYLSEQLQETLMTQCVARLEAEEKAKAAKAQTPAAVAKPPAGPNAPHPEGPPAPQQN